MTAIRGQSGRRDRRASGIGLEFGALARRSWSLRSRAADATKSVLQLSPLNHPRAISARYASSFTA